MRAILPSSQYAGRTLASGRHRIGAARVLAVVVFVAVTHASSTAAVELAGTVWAFSGGVGKAKLASDQFVKVKSRRKALIGDSCCDGLDVASPSDSSFSLRHRGYEVVTGRVVARQGAYVLQPDGPSQAILPWWVENEAEFFWNVAVFDVSLQLHLDSLIHSTIVVTPKKAVGDQPQGVVTVNVAARGDIVSYDVSRGRRFADGPTRTILRYKQKLSYVAPIDEDGTPLPYPPIVPCDEDAGASSYEPDFCR